MGKVYICLRYDDFGMKEEALEYDRQLVRMADETGAKVTISIVPHAENCKNNRELLFDSTFFRAYENGKIEIAVHGYKHRRGFFEKLMRIRGEFGNKPYILQKYEIKKGLKEWENDLKLPNTDIFVPPYNTYDAKTVHVLADNGFRIISDGAESNKKFRNKVPDKNILRVPFTCGIEVSREIANELIQKDGEYIIVALFHHYNYPIESVLELGNFFENEENVQFITLEEISKRIDSKSLAEMETAKHKYYKID